MQTRKIGSLNVSVIGLGCNNFGGRLPDYEDSERVLLGALDNGINFFDTADVYGNTKSEEYMGRALKSRRSEAIIATKFGMKGFDSATTNTLGLTGGATPVYIKQAVENSLRRLDTDYIDLFQLHTPDLDTPISDTLAALDELVKAGKIREIGCSNFTVEQLREADEARKGGARFVSVQNHYNLFYRDTELPVLDECLKTETAYLPYFPLARGLLTGKYRLGYPFPESARLPGLKSGDYLNQKNLLRVEKLLAYAEGKGHTLLDLAFAWTLYHPAVSSVIAGAMSVEQIQQNVSTTKWAMSAEEYAEINAIVIA
jgi:aryl-alcohol dehydrogenase-like predicted oxidoreductase